MADTSDHNLAIPVGKRDFDEKDGIGQALLDLNNLHAVELSRLTRERFGDLLSEAFFARRIGQADAFLMAFDQDARYDSPNFLWFRERFERFVYVDRIVVAAHARGRGLANLLYGELFGFARQAGHERIVCEVNLDPPNPASMAFHASLGFAEIGSGSVANGGKTVSYLERKLGENAN